MDITILQGLWFILIGVLIAGYFILDGFDLGAGVLYPFIAKDDREKALVRRAVGPVWDGNEVWLLTAGGALFAAFAPAYAATFSGFYLAVMLVLFGLIARAISLEFRHHDPTLGKVWDGCFFIGSLLPALLLGVALGNVIGGIELNTHGDYIGGFLALLDPFSLVCGLIGLSVMITLGASWLCVKVEPSEALYQRAQRVRVYAVLVAIVLLVLASILYLTRDGVLTDPYGGRIAIACAVIALIALIGALALFKKGTDLPAHIVLSITCLALVGVAAGSIFPNIVPATDPALSLSIAASASSEYALGAMTIITCIGLPLVLIYHVIIYRTFAGKITNEDLDNY